MNVFHIKCVQYKTTQYNTLNVKLYNSQLHKLKLGIQDVNVGSNDENNFLHKFLITNTQI